MFNKVSLKSGALVLAIIITFFFLSEMYFTHLEKGDWYIKDMNIEKLNTLSTGREIKVAIIDSGVSKDILNVKRVNLTETNEYDDNGHGTITYNLIHAVAPDAEITSFKVMEADESISPELVIEALKQCLKEDVDIVNISLGSTQENDEVSNLIDELYKNGTVVVSSVGDYEQSFKLFPASDSNVIAIGSYDTLGNEWTGDNDFGNNNYLFPGVDINVIDNTNRTVKTSGTSYSSALASGYIALLLESNNLTPKDVSKIFDELNGSNYYDILQKSQGNN